MTLPHIAVWKIGYTAIGLLTATIYAIDPTYKVFILAVIIAAIPQMVTGIFGLMHDRRMERKLDNVGEKVDGINSKLREDEKLASARADHAEGFTKGSDSERERGK
jgi:hypothetical protein